MMIREVQGVEFAVKKRKTGVLKRDWEDLQGLSGLCGKYATELYDQIDYESLYARKWCSKLWCPTCGGKGGRVHMRRFGKLSEFVENLNVDVSGLLLRQFVFTIPVEYRSYFYDREVINKYFSGLSKFLMGGFGAMRKVISEEHPRGVTVRWWDKPVVAYLHVHGDIEENDAAAEIFHPHFNFHIFDRLGKGVIDLKVLKVSYEVFFRGFMKKVCGVEVGVDAKTNFYYSWEVGKNRKKFYHKLKYMCVPVDPRFFERFGEKVQYGGEVGNDFLIGKMDGFQYIRYWGIRNKNLKVKEMVVYMKKKMDVDFGDDEKFDKGRYVYMGETSMKDLGKRAKDNGLVLCERKDGLLVLCRPDEVKGRRRVWLDSEGRVQYMN